MKRHHLKHAWLSCKYHIDQSTGTKPFFLVVERLGKHICTLLCGWAIMHLCTKTLAALMHPSGRNAMSPPNMPQSGISTRASDQNHRIIVLKRMQRGKRTLQCTHGVHERQTFLPHPICTCHHLDVRSAVRTNILAARHGDHKPKGGRAGQSDKNTRCRAHAKSTSQKSKAFKSESLSPA